MIADSNIEMFGAKGHRMELADMALCRDAMRVLNTAYPGYRWMIVSSGNWIVGPVEVGLGLVYFVFTTLVLLRFTDSFVWLAVLIIRNPWVQQRLGWLRGIDR